MMEDNIIVLYDNKKLIVQSTSVITSGLLKVIDRNNIEHELYTCKISNTDFISVNIDLPRGKFQVQIITEKTTVKNIMINQR